MSSFISKNPELEALQADVLAAQAEVAARFENDPKFRNDIAQEISETIYEGFLNDNLIELFTETKRLPRNGRATIREVRGLKAFHIARGSYIKESKLHAEVTEIEKDQVGFHIVENTDVLEENFGETAETLVNLGGRRVDAVINQRVLGTYQAAIDSSSPYYIASSNLTLTELDNAIAGVQDETESGANPTIIGRATMVRKIISALTVGNTFPLFTPETNEDLLRRGVLGNYKGINIIQLNNHKDEYGNSYFPGNELWFISRDAGTTAFFGEPKTKNFIEDDNWYWHYIYRIEYGVIVTRPERCRRLVDSSVAP